MKWKEWGKRRKRQHVMVKRQTARSCGSNARTVLKFLDRAHFMGWIARSCVSCGQTVHFLLVEGKRDFFLHFFGIFMQKDKTNFLALKPCFFLIILDNYLFPKFFHVRIQSSLMFNLLSRPFERTFKRL